MLGGFLMLRRSMLDELGGFDEGYRLYGEDIDLAYRAAQAGWERWYVPAAVVRHEHKAVTDKRWLTRRTLWHWARHRPLRPQAPRAAARAMTSGVNVESNCTPKRRLSGTPVVGAERQRRRRAPGRPPAVARAP